MARIPDADIDRVKRQTDLLALVRSRGVELKKHGGQDWIGRCPFHDDQSNPNFIVSPDKGLFHCMACGKAGNPIQFVQFHDGLSFRHAFEVLRQGGSAVFAAQPLQKQTTVVKLSCPLEKQADDAALLAQVAAYYHQRLKETPSARAYLASRGLDCEELIDRYQLGFADRTLGLRLPDKNRQEGERLRARLTQLGLWRESGHEHFNGCIVVPMHDDAGNVVSFYGRRAQRGTLRHLYPPGPHRGLFNREALKGGEIILCEAVFDALTFCAHGFANATCLFGTEGFTEELWKALRKLKGVRIAYDADDAGERAAQRDAERFRAHGIEVYRIKFPWGMDANEYACKVKPADKSLALLINSATWVGGGSVPVAAPSLPAASPPPSEVLNARAPAPFPSLAAPVSSLPASHRPEPAAKEEKLAPASPTLEQRGDAWFLDLEGREYRVAGLDKTLGTDALKVTLRLRVVSQGSALFHLDQLDGGRKPYSSFQ